jgi:hypothetical protein
MSSERNVGMEFLRHGLFGVKKVYFCSISNMYLNICVADTRYCQWMYYFYYIVKEWASMET